jgi:hypothetical protein
MGARHYSPSLGRFLQPDPSAAEANLYGYGANSPVSRVDPSGLACQFTIILGPQALFISCGAVAVGTAAAALASYFATHPVTVPCVWNCHIDVRVRGVAPASVSSLAGRDSWWRKTIKQGWNLAKESRRSQKERSTDVPSWARGKTRLVDGETPSRGADRIMREQYGPGWRSRPNANKEWSQIQKRLSRR